MNMLIDAENNTAVIPGDGNTPLVLTHSSDAARFVVALLDVTNWKRRYSIVGNRTTLNDAVRLAEKVKGVKFDVQYFPLESLERGEYDLTPSMKAALPDEGIQSYMKSVLSLSGIGLLKGHLDLNPDESLTLELPSIKPLTIREVWEAWK
jgi:nucleoside-diphosphate-sugar epimerase